MNCFLRVVFDIIVIYLLTVVFITEYRTPSVLLQSENGAYMYIDLEQCCTGTKCENQSEQLLVHVLEHFYLNQTMCLSTVMYAWYIGFYIRV